jgi:hypothetical protein
MPTRCVKQPDSAADQSKVALQPGKNVVVHLLQVTISFAVVYPQNMGSHVTSAIPQEMSVSFRGRKRNSAWQRVLQLAVTIERPQSRHKNQVAGLRSPVGSSFVPIPASRGSPDRTFAATVRDSEAVFQIKGGVFVNLADSFARESGSSGSPSSWYDERLTDL